MARMKSRTARSRRRRGEKPLARAPEASAAARAVSRLRGIDLPARLQAVLSAAEAVITETRRVIQVVRRDMTRQRAATRLVLTGRPSGRRRRGRAPRRRRTRK